MTPAFVLLRKVKTGLILLFNGGKRKAFFWQNVPRYSWAMKAIYRYAALQDQRYYQRHPILPLPPAPLRMFVHNDISINSFIQAGEATVKDIRAALTKNNLDVESFRTVLDFGCGCGRTLRCWGGSLNEVEMYGTDTDNRAIEWCQGNMEFGNFDVNTPTPPTIYDDNQFDFIYAISVFTHLREDYQMAWLKEFRRIAAPGGVLVLSLHGEHLWQKLPEPYISQVRNSGFTFYSHGTPEPGSMAEWYQDAFCSEEYVRERYSELFSVIDFIPRGLHGYQDLVVLRKEFQPVGAQ